MEKSFNFKVTSRKPLSLLCKKHDLSDFFSVCRYIKKLPYKRISNISNLSLVLVEGCGTCSTKHAFIKQLAVENNITHLNLCIGIYKMNATNTFGVENILNTYDLDYIPEAHTYLRFYDHIIDVTGLKASNESFTKTLIHEETIRPDQIGLYKTILHQRFIKEWAKSNAIKYSLHDLWNIRTWCIEYLIQTRT